MTGFLRTRIAYLASRARRLDPGSLLDRADGVAHRFDRRTPVIVADMLWQAAFHQVGFQDYVDFDFAILTRAERRTMMTHPLSNQLSQKYDDPRDRHIFHDKLEFDRVFADFLGREWMTLEPENSEALRAFAQRHPVFITKTARGQAGLGIRRYDSADVQDWRAFHERLFREGELLVEEQIVQHADLAAVCAGTVNSTRVVSFFDGTTTHVLAVAQKFGRGQAADQMSFGGFYTMLDPDTGRALGDGYDSHGHVHAHHPESGYRIAEFRLPLFDEVIALVDQLARHVPRVQYVGWDIAVTPTGPVVIEGNWGAGVYEVKPTVLGIRTGHRPRYRAAIGF